jgi:hypothetical protein
VSKKQITELEEHFLTGEIACEPAEDGGEDEKPNWLFRATLFAVGVGAAVAPFVADHGTALAGTRWGC